MEDSLAAAPRLAPRNSRPGAVTGRGQWPRRPDVRFNFLIGVLDGSFFGLAVGLASYVTVLPLFVHGLTDSAVVMGSISAIRVAGWQMPQLL